MKNITRHVTNKIRHNIGEMRATLFFERRPNYFLVNAIVPIFMVTAFTSFTFVLDRVGGGSRVDLYVTIFLTIIALRFSFAAALPESDTQTYVALPVDALTNQNSS